MTSLTKQNPQYECFRDAAYYDLWAVREAGETRWGHCFHVQTKEEAEGLVRLLNDAMKENADLRHDIERAVARNTDLLAQNDFLKQISDSQPQTIDATAKRLHEARKIVQQNAHLQRLFEALMNVPDDVTMAEVRETMKEALRGEGQ